MPTTAGDLIRSSMRLIGAVATGETLTAEEAQDGLAVLNDLLDAWSVEGLMLYRSVRESFALVPGQSAYTIGAGADFDTTRPVRVDGVVVTDGGADVPVRGPVADADWDRIVFKSLAHSTPTLYRYDAAHPTATLHLWPVPSKALPIVLTMSMQFSRLASIAESISYPPGYAKALRYALAMDLAPEFSVAVSPDIREAARQIIGRVKAANRRQPTAQFDAGLLAASRFGSRADFEAGL